MPDDEGFEVRRRRPLKVLAAKKVAQKRQAVYDHLQRMHDSKMLTSIYSYEQNAAKSPLLRLPPELRNRMYRLVLGDRTLHISPSAESGLYKGSVCIADLDDHEDAQHIKAKHSEEHDSYWVRHKACGSRQKLVRTADMQLATNILQVCREIHAEAALIPFQDNTFSFSEMGAVEPFLREIVPAQARAIQAITLVSGYDDGTDNSKLIENKLMGLKRLTCFVEFGFAGWSLITLGRVNMRQECTATLAPFYNTPAQDATVAAYRVKYSGKNARMINIIVARQGPLNHDMKSIWAAEMETELRKSVEERHAEKARKEQEKEQKKAAFKEARRKREEAEGERKAAELAARKQLRDGKFGGRLRKLKG